LNAVPSTLRWAPCCALCAHKRGRLLVASERVFRSNYMLTVSILYS